MKCETNSIAAVASHSS